MKSVRNLPLHSRRDAWVEVNLGAIEHNARLLRRMLPPDMAMMAIVKADAYGHGAAMVLPTLEASGVSMAGVAAMDEAIHIRQAGLKLPVLVIGAVPDWAVPVAADYDIQLTVFDSHHLDILAKAHIAKPIKVHIKVDTGMHRIGIAWERAAEFVRHCRNLEFIRVEGIFSHLADSYDPQLTGAQLDRWHQVLDGIDELPRWVHIGNSGYVLSGHYEMHPPNNLVRMGYAFFGYGASPSVGLQPAMSVKARLMHIQDVPPDTGISYGHTWRTPANSPRRVATVPLGYADGVMRTLSNRIEAILRGQRVPQVGTITMDQLMVDITDVPEAAVGDAVTLIGTDGREAIWLDDWAARAGTIPYELMCALRVRLPKTYTR